MAARNDFHWLRFLLISVYHIWQSVCFKTFSHHFTMSVHSRGYGLQRPVISRPLSGSRSLPHSLDCDLRCLLFQSSDIQTHREWGNSKPCWISLPCLAKTPSFLLSFFLLSVPRGPRSVSRAWFSDFVHGCVCDVSLCSVVVWAC